MRMFSWSFVAIVLLLGAASWWRWSPPTSDAHVVAVASNDSLAAATFPRSGHQFEATAAVRYPHHREVSSGEVRSAPSGSDRSAAQAAQRDAAGSDIAQEAQTAPEPRSAGELFVPFIADDPKQVFLPATAQYHSALQGETQDPEWGPAAADALRGYIAAQFGDRFEIPYVDCRQDLCELQVAGRIGADLPSDVRDIQNAMSRMQQQPWWSTLQFDQESGTVGSSQDGRMLLLWFFSRK